MTAQDLSSADSWSHPGIVFVTAVTGERRAALAVGPQVWVVAESWQQHGGSSAPQGWLPTRSGSRSAMLRQPSRTGPTTGARSTI